MKLMELLPLSMQEVVAGKSINTVYWLMFLLVRLRVRMLFFPSLSSQGSADMDTEELPHTRDLTQSYPGQTEDYSSQEKTGGDDADVDSTSCTNSHGSSLSDRRDLDEFDAEGVEDELTQLKTVAALCVMQDEGDERERSVGFDLNSVCEQGKTLLWDLIQDDNAVSTDAVVKLMFTIVCVSLKVGRCEDNDNKPLLLL